MEIDELKLECFDEAEVKGLIQDYRDGLKRCDRNKAKLFNVIFFGKDERWYTQSFNNYGFAVGGKELLWGDDETENDDSILVFTMIEED